MKTLLLAVLLSFGAFAQGGTPWVSYSSGPGTWNYHGQFLTGWYDQYYDVLISQDFYPSDGNTPTVNGTAQCNVANPPQILTQSFYEHISCPQGQHMYMKSLWNSPNGSSYIIAQSAESRVPDGSDGTDGPLQMDWYSSGTCDRGGFTVYSWDLYTCDGSTWLDGG